MIKTPLSTVIGGAFWTPEATIIGGTSKTLNQLIKSLFSNGEQGFTRTPGDLSTMYQDAAGTVPVTGVGQAVGLILDKSKGLSLRAELATTSNVVSVPIGGAAYTTYPIANIQVGKPYRITFTVTNYAGSLDVGIAGPTTLWLDGLTVAVTSNNTLTCTRTFVGASGVINLYTRSTNQCVFSNISVREVAGNHAYQTTSSMRPLLVASPQRLDYDTVDDKLVTTLPAQLTGCTVIRSVPNVGTQILTGQTIPTTYNDNTDHCGLIVINRALTPSETSAITAEFNKRAGV